MSELSKVFCAEAAIADLQQQLKAERRRCAAAEAEAAALRLTADIPLRNPSPILRLSSDGQLQYANPAAESMRVEFERTGHSWVRAQLLDAAQLALASGQPEGRSLTIGRQYFVVMTVPVCNEDYVMVYFNDVTVQHQAETQLQEQYAFYETLMEHLPVVVVVLGPDQRYRFLNHYVAPDHVARQARIGTTFAEHCAKVGLPRRLATRRRRMFERASQTRTLVAWEETWPITPTQPARHWQCFYQPVYGPDGHLHVMMCYGVDVTTQRQAEEKSRADEAAVRTQQEFTSRVLDLNPNVVYVRDTQQRFVFTNKALLKLWADVRAKVGTTSDDNGFSKAELAAYAAVDAEVLFKNAQVESEDKLTLPDGEVRWYQTMKCPLPTPTGEVHVLGVSTDITALKAAQLAAEASATARENFLANMSHEIRTPLNGVLGMAGLLAKTTLNEQQRNQVNIIQQSGQHLLAVVNDVLDMAKITSGKLEMEHVPFNICDVMGQALTPLMSMADEKGLRLIGTRLRDSCPHPWVISDPHRLRQIMLNLVSNAIKFTPRGGTVAAAGYLVAETADTLTTEFRVTDTGIGISPDKLEAIFQEFTQAYADTSRQFGGTGLGLSISRALVKELGGQLTVQSELGKGSSFSFIVKLPKPSAAAVDRARKAAAVPAITPDASVQGCRVLLVEDNAVNREVAQLLLEGHGVVVDTAEGGHEALEKFEQHSYDLVLMDIQMPGMNGLEATARIRQHPDAARAATPVLALTANAFTANAEKYRAAGMNDTLAKPFSEQELVGKIAALLAGAAAPAPATNNAEATPKARPKAKIKTSASVKAQTSAGAVSTNFSSVELPLFDLKMLHATAQGSQPFIDRILKAFRSQTPISINALWAAIATHDLLAAAALAHKLRPSLRLLGAHRLAPHYTTLEDEAAAPTARQAAAQAFAEGLEKLLDALPE